MIIRKFFTFAIIFLFICSCKKQIENPETLDPIYLDLISETKEYEKSLENMAKDVITLESQIADKKLSGSERRAAQEELFRTKKEISTRRQKLEFYKISAESRLIYVRKEYLEHFKKDLAWPNPKKTAVYQKNKSLSESSKTWERGAASSKPTKTEKKTASSKH